MPAVHDTGNIIILANLLNKKSIEYTYNIDIPVRLLGYIYVLIFRSILCNCELEADDNFWLDFLAACLDSSTNLKMYFTVKLDFCTTFTIRQMQMYILLICQS